MIAKDIAAGLDGTWKHESENTLYLHTTKRIRVIIEEYQPTYEGVFIPENEDYIESDKDFINEFEKSIGMQLCSDQEMKLIEALTDNVSQWSKNFEKNDQMVTIFLQNLLDKHNAKTKKYV